MTDDDGEGLMQVHLAAWCQHIPIRSMTSIIISSLLIESKVHQMWCAFRPNDCRLHIAKHGLLHFSEKASLAHQPLKSRHIFSNLHAWIYIFTATLPWKKETQQQKLGRRKFAQCPFAVIFITLKKMIDVETILEAKKKEAFFVDRKNMMWQFFLTFAAVCWSHFVSWPNWLDRCNGASFSQTFSLSSYISMMFIAALQLLIWKVTQTSHLDYP